MGKKVSVLAILGLILLYLIWRQLQEPRETTVVQSGCC